MRRVGRIAIAEPWGQTAERLDLTIPGHYRRGHEKGERRRLKEEKQVNRERRSQLKERGGEARVGYNFRDR